MFRSAHIRLAPATLLLAAAGCAAPTPNPRYPSLLPRAIETRSDAEPEATLPVTATVDPATDASIAAIRSTLTATAAAFDAAAATAERDATAAQGDPVGGERWITAQAALATLDGLHATTSATLTEIDDLARSRASAGEPAYPALDALHEDAQAAADAETARIAKIQARLPSA